MRATRGLLASLGASTALVLAAAAALFSVSTIVAFRGWPGVEAPLPLAGADRITVASSAGPDMALASRPRRIVVPEVEIERRRADPPRAAAVADASTATSVLSRPRAAIRRRIPDSIPSPPAGGSRPPAPDDATRDPRPAAAGDAARGVGSGIGGTVGGVTGGLGDTVRPVSPTLGRTLDEAGRSLDQTIGGLMDAVGTTVDVLTSGAPPR